MNKNKIMKKDEELTEPPTCPICDYPFFNKECYRCEYKSPIENNNNLKSKL